MDVWLSPRSKRKDSRGKGREVGRINPRLCTGTVSQVEGGTAKIRIPFSFFLFFFSLSPLPYFFPLFHSSSPSSPLHFVLEKSPLTTNNLAVEGEGGFLGEESATSVPWPRGKGLCGEVCDDGKWRFSLHTLLVTIHESERIETLVGWLERMKFLRVSFGENIIYGSERIWLGIIENNWITEKTAEIKIFPSFEIHKFLRFEIFSRNS